MPVALAARSWYRRGERTKKDHYAQLHTRLKEDRSSFDSHWQEIADFMLPRRIRRSVSDRNKGDKRNQNIINSAARFSIRTLQSGLHAGLTSPARPWMKLATPDPDLAKFEPVKEWLHEVTRRMLDVFALTNLYNTLPIVYGDIGVFGTGAMSILPDDEELCRTSQYPIGSYVIGLSKKGKANTFLREYELTVEQVVEEFAVRPGYRDIDRSVLSRTVLNLWDKGDDQAPVPLTWVVSPNRGRDPRAFYAADRMPFVSCHYETGESKESVFLRESGFEQFPIMAPRWDITGEDTYGTDCPGMSALGDVKQLQIEERRKGQAIQKMIDPALVGPAELRTQKTSLLPGDVTYINIREGMQGLKPIHEVRIDINHLTIDIDQVVYRIQRNFYEDLFLMLARSDPRRGQQPITAREVEERHEEKLIALGPVLDRTNDELLDPLVERIYAMMEAAGMIPDPPDELDNVRLKVEYTSILAQAQKLVGIAQIDRFFQSVLPMSEVAPEVLDKVDFMAAVDVYADTLGIDPHIIRTNEEATQRTQARAQQQQQAAQAEQMEMMASAAQKAGNTPMQGDTALKRLMGAG